MSNINNRKKTLMEAREQLREKYESNLRFIEQLLLEKGELRDTVIDRLSDIESQMMHLETENGELRSRLMELQKQMADMAKSQENESTQLQAVLLQEESMINVQVASFQLHSTMDFMEIITLVGEVIINLVGSENFALCLKRRSDDRMVPVHAWGAGGRQLEAFSLGEGVIGKVLADGSAHYWRRERGASEDGSPMAAIPLTLSGEIIGALVIYDLLPQKEALGPTDDDLLDCIGTQGASALMGAHLFSCLGKPSLAFEGDTFDLSH